jgi:DNA mismatch repair protein MutL
LGNTHLPERHGRLTCGGFLDDPAQRALQEGRRRLLAAIACKGAIKAHKLLMPEEQQLLEQLQQAELPTICPHGAPIIMNITQYELDKKFIR